MMSAVVESQAALMLPGVAVPSLQEGLQAPVVCLSQASLTRHHHHRHRR